MNKEEDKLKLMSKLSPEFKKEMKDFFIQWLQEDMKLKANVSMLGGSNNWTINLHLWIGREVISSIEITPEIDRIKPRISWDIKQKK